MTLGDYRGTTPGITRAATSEPQAQPSTSRSEHRRSVRPEAPPPAQSQARRDGRLGSRTAESTSEPTQIAAGVNEESMFVPAAEDDDQQWDPPEDRDEEEEARLGWDASGNHVSRLTIHVVVKDVLTASRARRFILLSLTVSALHAIGTPRRADGAWSAYSRRKGRRRSKDYLTEICMRCTSVARCETNTARSLCFISLVPVESRPCSRFGREV